MMYSLQCSEGKGAEGQVRVRELGRQTVTAILAMPATFIVQTDRHTGRTTATARYVVAPVLGSFWSHAP